MDQDCSGLPDDVKLTDSYASRPFICLGTFSMHAAGDNGFAGSESGEPAPNLSGANNQRTIWARFTTTTATTLSVRRVILVDEHRFQPDRRFFGHVGFTLRCSLSSLCFAPLRRLDLQVNTFGSGFDTILAVYSEQPSGDAGSFSIY